MMVFTHYERCRRCWVVGTFYELRVRGHVAWCMVHGACGVKRSMVAPLSFMLSLLGALWPMPVSICHCKLGSDGKSWLYELWVTATDNVQGWQLAGLETDTMGP
jgi:hypothetical protein